MMKFNLNSIFSFLVLILLLNGCASSRNKQCPDFGGGSWNIDNNKTHQFKSIHSNDDISISQSILEMAPNASSENVNHHLVKLNRTKLVEMVKQPQVKAVYNEFSKVQKTQEKNAKTSIKRKIGRSIGWLSVISGLIGMLNIASIAFSIMAILIGLLGIKLKISNWGTILSYIGIGFGLLGILSPILNTIVGILILAVLILILLKMFHYI